MPTKPNTIKIVTMNNLSSKLFTAMIMMIVKLARKREMTKLRPITGTTVTLIIETATGMITPTAVPNPFQLPVPTIFMIFPIQ